MYIDYNTFPLFGTVSHGTMLDDDLHEAFVDALATLERWYKRQDAHDMADECATCIRRAYTADSVPVSDDERAEQVRELCEALDANVPPYFYFGAHEGDGSSYGFWFADDPDGDVPRLSDASELDSLGIECGEAFVINDHGNVTLYAWNGSDWSEVWSIV